MRAWRWTPALQALLVGCVVADDCSTTVTITDATPAMTSCATFTGDVIVHSTFSGTVSLADVATISGYIYATGVPHLEGISLPAIEHMDGIQISDANNFTSFDYALSSNADYANLGNVDFSNLPAFPGYGFQYLNGISNLTFDNLSSIDNLYFSWTGPNVGMGELVLIDNAILENVSVPFVSGNGISITGNDIMGSIAFDYMTEIASATITANPSMTSIVFPSLTAIAGDFVLAASHDVYLDLNSSLIKSIGGNLDLTGDISWTLDEDVVVNGSVTITYNAEAGDEYKCDQIEPGILTITCNGKVMKPTTSTGAGGSVTGTAGAGNGAAGTAHGSNAASTAAASSRTSGLTKGAKIGIGLGIGLGVFGIASTIAAVLLLLRLRKSRAAAAAAGGPGHGQRGVELGEQKLPPAYNSLWRGRSTKKSGTGSAEPMMPGGEGAPPGPQELHGSEGVVAHELESPRPSHAGFASMHAQGQQQQPSLPPVEMEGDHNWRRSELMGDTGPQR